MYMIYDFLRKVASLIETNGRNVASLINKQCLAEARKGGRG